jgi:DNA primase
MRGRGDLAHLREQVKGATDCRLLAEELGFKRVGGKYLCHGERNASAIIDRDHLHCFSCGLHLDCFGLVMKALGCSFKEALEYLAHRLGLALPWTPTTTRRALPPVAKVTSSPFPSNDETAPAISPERRAEILTSFCQAALLRESATSKSHPGLDYLERRGISPATARACGLGYVTDYRKATDWLHERFPLDELKASGLFSARGTLRTYRHRLLLPYWLDGQVLGLQARNIEGGQPKELTLGPVAIPFNADALLGEPGDIYITEGAIDCLSLVEQGLAAVAIPGAGNFRPAWVGLFEGWQVVLAFDADEPGRRATERVAALFAAEGRAVQTLTLPPDCKDVNELLRKAA